MCFPQVLIVLERSKYFHSCRSGCWTFYCQWESCPSENIEVEPTVKGIRWQGVLFTRVREQPKMISAAGTKQRRGLKVNFLFYSGSSARLGGPSQMSGLLTVATRFKTPQAVLTYISWALEGNKRGKCSVSTELTKSSMAPGSPCSDPNLIRLQAGWVLFVKCPHTHANPPPWLPPAPAAMLTSSLSWMTATAFYQLSIPPPDHSSREFTVLIHSHSFTVTF